MLYFYKITIIEILLHIDIFILYLNNISNSHSDLLKTVKMLPTHSNHFMLKPILNEIMSFSSLMILVINDNFLI